MKNRGAAHSHDVVMNPTAVLSATSRYLRYLFSPSTGTCR